MGTQLFSGAVGACQSPALAPAVLRGEQLAAVPLPLLLGEWLPTYPSQPGEEGPGSWKSAGAQVSIWVFTRWLPESARWLIITGKPEQALQELRKVARINGHKEATKSLTVEVRAPVCDMWDMAGKQQPQMPYRQLQHCPLRRQK